MFKKLMPFGIVLLSIAIATLLIIAKPEPKQKEPEQLIPTLEVVQVIKQDVPITIRAYGVVEPSRSADLVSELKGTINWLSPKFEVGQFVKQGEVLLTLTDGDYQADLMQAKASLAQAKVSLTEEIARGEVARKTLRNTQNTNALGLRIPQRQQEEANVEYAKAAVARAERNIAKTQIRAPFSGLISQKRIHIGSYINVGTQVGELLGTKIAHIRLAITPESFSLLPTPWPERYPVTLTTEVASHIHHYWQGELIRSEGVIDKNSRMVYLLAEVHDPYQLEKQSSRSLSAQPLQFGTFVSAQIRGKTIPNVIKLPRHVVRNRTVITIDENSKAKHQAVTVAREDLNYAYITDGLKDAEIVSLIRPEQIVDGLKVNVVESQSFDPSINVSIEADSGKLVPSLNSEPPNQKVVK
ncbi:efflux RND transporter periplasmic adaptor subunit [Photobacterium damselae]|uniref:efflux RND transporter periplasmic adaptor subunit n=1 Tax=Photobacterium damselae TaxID=38293 RepID=UPI002543425A